MSSGSCGERFHQLEALGAHRLQLLEPGLVRAPRGLGEIVERHRIEIVVGERDEPEPAPPQIHDLPITASTVRCRGRWPSVFHTEQNEQCFGQPRTVCTDAHMYLPGGISDQRAGLKSPPSTLPPSYIGSGAPLTQSSMTCAHTRSPSPLTMACASPSASASSG